MRRIAGQMLGRAPLSIVLAVTVAFVLAGCGAPVTSSPGDCPEPRTAPGSHLAPELEALIPKNVAGRDLATWSLSGRCWVLFAGSGPTRS